MQRLMVIAALTLVPAIGSLAQDEVACYESAVGNTGSDPFDLARQSEAQQQQTEAQMQQAEAAGTTAGPVAAAAHGGTG